MAVAAGSPDLLANPAARQAEMLRLAHDMLRRDIAPLLGGAARDLCRLVERNIVAAALAADFMPALDAQVAESRIALVSRAARIVGQSNAAAASALGDRLARLPATEPGRAAALRVALDEAARALGTLTGRDPNALTCAHALVRLEGEVAEARERRRRELEEIVAEARPAEDAGFDRVPELEGWLRDHFPADRNLRVTSARMLPGGYSMDTVLFTIEGASTLPSELILRANRPLSVTGKLACNEFALLRFVRDAGLPVAEPIAAEDQPGLLGTSFIIVGRLPGRSGDFFTELSDLREIGPGFLTKLAGHLATLHRLPLDAAARVLTPAPPSDADGLRQQVQALRDRYHALVAAPAPLIELAFDWLLRNAALGSGAEALVHGDIRLNNLMVDRGELAGIIDWEVAHIGHPAEDIGYAMEMIGQLGDFDRFMADYLAAGGHPAAADRGAIAFYALLLPAVRNSVYTAVPSGEFLSGRAVNVMTATCFSDALARLEGALARALKLALVAAD